VFDGKKTYTNNQDLRVHQYKNVSGDNVLTLSLSQPLPAGSTFTYYYENNDADEANVSAFVQPLKTYLLANNYSISNFDMNNDGKLTDADFDVNGDGLITTSFGIDNSPLGMTIKLYLGDPGYPAGTGSGTLVQTEFSPIQLIKATVYEHSVMAVTNFDHIVFESNPDGSGKDPRLIEVELNC
jgi:hypothetical protein